MSSNVTQESTSKPSTSYWHIVPNHESKELDNEAVGYLTSSLARRADQIEDVAKKTPYAWTIELTDAAVEEEDTLPKTLDFARANLLIHPRVRKKGEGLKAQILEELEKLPALKRHIKELEQNGDENNELEGLYEKLSSLENKQPNKQRRYQNNIRAFIQVAETNLRRLTLEKDHKNELFQTYIQQRVTLQQEISALEAQMQAKPTAGEGEVQQQPDLEALNQRIQAKEAEYRTLDQRIYALLEERHTLDQDIDKTTEELAKWQELEYRPDIDEIREAAKLNFASESLRLSAMDKADEANSKSFLAAGLATLDYFYHEITKLFAAGDNLESVEEILSEAKSELEQAEAGNVIGITQQYIHDMLHEANSLLNSEEGVEGDRSVSEESVEGDRSVSEESVEGDRSVSEENVEGDRSVSEESTQSSELCEELQSLESQELFETVFIEKASKAKGPHLQALKEIQQQAFSRFMQIRAHSDESLEVKEARRVEFTDMMAKSTEALLADMGGKFVDGEPTLNRGNVIIKFASDASDFLTRYEIANPGKRGSAITLSTEKAYIAEPTGLDKVYTDAREAVIQKLDELEESAKEQLALAEQYLSNLKPESLVELRVITSRLHKLREESAQLLAAAKEQLGINQMFYTFQAALNTEGEDFAAKFVENWKNASILALANAIAAHQTLTVGLTSPLIPGDAIQPKRVSDFPALERGEDFDAEAERALRKPSFDGYSEAEQYEIATIFNRSNNLYAHLMRQEERNVQYCARRLTSMGNREFTSEMEKKRAINTATKELEAAQNVLKFLPLVLVEQFSTIEAEALSLIEALPNDETRLGNLERINKLARAKQEAILGSFQNLIEQAKEELSSLAGTAALKEREKVPFLGNEGDEFPGTHRVGDISKYSQDQQGAINDILAASNELYQGYVEEELYDFNLEAREKEISKLEAGAFLDISRAQDRGALRQITQEFKAKLKLIDQLLNMRGEAIEELEQSIGRAQRAGLKEVKRLNEAASKADGVKGGHYDAHTFTKKLMEIEKEARELIEQVEVTTLPRASAPTANKSTNTEVLDGEDYLNDVREEGEEELQPIELRLASAPKIREILNNADAKVAELMRSLDKAPPADTMLDEMQVAASTDPVELAPMIEKALQDTTPTLFERSYTWLTNFDLGNVGDTVLKILAWITLIFPVIVFTAMAAMHSLVWKSEAEVLRGQIAKAPVHGIKS